MKELFLLLLFCHVSSVKHSMKFFITASTGIPNFPDFMAAGQVDDIQADYCDSNSKIIEPKLDRSKNYFDKDAEHREWYTRECSGNLPKIFKASISILMQHFNHSEVKHSLEFFIAASTGIPNFPELIAFGLIDDVQAGHCDTNKKILEINLDWMKTYFDKDPEHLEMYTFECFGNLPKAFKALISIVMRQFNQSEVPPSKFPAVAVIGVVVGLLLLLLCISELWRRNCNGFRHANTSDSSPLDHTDRSYCDSIRKIPQVKQDWVKTYFDNDPEHLDWYTRECSENRPKIFKARISSLMQVFNQSE
ncbi:major histocompatibility complex class I-related gene protein-like isoform X5, partial [Lates japonicus]